MTTATPSTVTEAEPGTEDNTPDLWHLWCCDENVAMCGADISDVPVTDGEGEVQCIECRAIEENNLPCPVPGCQVLDAEVVEG